MVKRATSLFNSFCSSVAKHVARFSCPPYRSSTTQLSDNDPYYLCEALLFCTHATILAPTRRAWCFSCAFYFPHHWVALWSQEALPKFVRNKGLFSLISSLKVFIESRLLRLLIAQFTYLCFCVVAMPWRQYPVWVTSCAVLLSLLLDLFSSQVYLGSFFSMLSLGLEKTCRIRGVITDRLFDYSQNRWSRNLNVPVFCCC